MNITSDTTTEPSSDEISDSSAIHSKKKSRETEQNKEKTLFEESSEKESISYTDLLYHENDTQGEVFLVEEDRTMPSLDPCKCNHNHPEAEDPQSVTLTLPYVKHSRAISLPISSLQRWERGSSAPTSAIPTGQHIPSLYTSGGDLALDTFIRASSYSDLAKSPAICFLGEIAEMTAPASERSCISLPVAFQQVGNYTFIRQISSGTFSECWLGHPLGQPTQLLAIKVFLGSGGMEEISLWQTFEHPNILPLLDSFQMGMSESFSQQRTKYQLRVESSSEESEKNSFENYSMNSISSDISSIQQFSRFYAVSPIASHGSLMNIIEKTGTLPLNRIRKIFIQLVHAVQYLHDKLHVVHHDIKLENVLIDGADDHVFLCDFGFCEKFNLSKGNSLISDDIVEDWQCTGSLQYCAPELFEHGRFSSNCPPIERFLLASKADCWSLGVLLFALVKGEFPFGDDFVPRLKIAISKGKFERVGNDLVDDLLEHLMDVDAKRRFDCGQILSHPWIQLASE